MSTNGKLAIIGTFLALAKVNPAAASVIGLWSGMLAP